MDKKQTKSMQLVLVDRITIAEARRPWYLSFICFTGQWQFDGAAVVDTGYLPKSSQSLS